MEISIFLLHIIFYYILVAYFKNFPKHYNKVTLSTFRIMELESYSIVGVIYVRMHMYERDSYAHGIESNPSQLNDSTFFFSYSFFSICLH